MKKHFIIKSGDENAGFTAYIKFALNGILYAEQHDLIPVVNLSLTTASEDGLVVVHLVDEVLNENGKEQERVRL